MQSLWDRSNALASFKTSRQFLFSSFILHPFLLPPQKTSDFVRKNLRKPQQNPPSSTLVNPETLLAPRPSRPWGTAAAPGHCAGRHGLRREVERHAAFVRAKVLKSSRPARACESAVAATLCRRSPRRERHCRARRNCADRQSSIQKRRPRRFVDSWFDQRPPVS
jgi:hypothetical protein